MKMEPRIGGRAVSIHGADPMAQARRLRDALAMADDGKDVFTRLFDEMSDTYDQIIPVHAYFGERLVIAAGVTEGDHVLDVGTGHGACLIPAARIVGQHGRATGIDLSHEMIERLNQAIDGAQLRHVDARHMDAEDLHLPDGSFDVVLGAFVLFFFADRMRALSQCFRVLKPGGTIALSTFANDSLGYPWFAEVIAPFLPPDGPRADAAQTFLHVDTEELHEHLRRAGFQSPRSETVERAFHFASADEHWNWLMTNGHRVAIQRVDGSKIADLRASIAQRLELERDGTGYRFDRPTRFTFATRGT
jgi:O-methyltransferase/aklanonic acid methyltransferase